MSVSDCSKTSEGLPKQFVSSLRILFEILDENRSGYVRLCDIESRWSENGVKGLPQGVVEALKKVTPSNGLLSFGNFVSGLKIALVKTKALSNHNGKENRGHSHVPRRDIPRGRGDIPRGSGDNARVQSQPPPQTARGFLAQGPTVTAAVKPNNAANTNYRIPYNNSAPNLQSDSVYKGDVYRVPPRPEMPAQYRKSTDVPPDIPPREITKSGRVLNELKNWQHERHAVSATTESRERRLTSNSENLKLTRGDKYAIYANIEQFQRKNNEETTKGNPNSIQTGSTTQKLSTEAPQRPVRRQNSARRHTLTSGLDYNAIKRMKQCEDERDMLLQGLEAVDLTRDWYRKQIAALHEKQKYIGRAALNEHSVEAHQERMNFQKVRINEVNHQLKTLCESSEKGFPLHMNLAIRASRPPNDGSVKMLKDQNRQLTQEVSHKSEKITQLEREKAALIRELFESRSKHKTNYDDTTFM